jgi:hypothetical protein
VGLEVPLRAWGLGDAAQCVKEAGACAWCSAAGRQLAGVYRKAELMRVGPATKFVAMQEIEDKRRATCMPPSCPVVLEASNGSAARGVVEGRCGWMAVEMAMQI